MDQFWSKLLDKSCWEFQVFDDSISHKQLFVEYYLWQTILAYIFSLLCAAVKQVGSQKLSTHYNDGAIIL